MKPKCPRCRFIHPSNLARAVGVFGDGPTLYQAANYPDAPKFGTRSEAEQDACEHWQGHR